MKFASLLQITIPIISCLSITLHALENSRGLICQFDICSCVHAFASSLLIQETVNVILLASLLRNLILHLFLNVLSKLRINEKKP